MAKWPNYFISGKQFQKRPNGNPVLYSVVRASHGFATLTSNGRVSGESRFKRNSRLVPFFCGKEFEKCLVVAMLRTDGALTFS